VDLFLGPYLKVVGGGIAKLLALLVFDVAVPKHEPPDTRTSVLGDIHPERP
jgi:hypothetical protein